VSFPRSADPGLLIVLLLFAFLAIGTLFIDPVRTTYGLKSDEATYVSMALSIAHDGDLAFQQRDLARFWPFYESGPEGIFLKRGKGPEDRLYFGKSFLYPLVAAPFVRVAGLNGLLLLNVLLLAGTFVCLYLYAAARMASSSALLVSTGFLGASITPLFGVWMMPETFNLALVGVAYFFWLYKEVRPRPDGGSADPHGGQGTDVVAAVLLGLATFSKPSNLVLILPLIALAWWRGQLVRGLTIGVIFGLVVAAGFGANGLISGELNYQGGERKTFYGEYPFQHDEATFNNLGISVTTESLEFEGWRHLGRNTAYFLFGRHFGLVPYYFPAVVVVVWALIRRQEREAWHAFIAGAVAVTALTLLLLLPNTWSGGGGPPGNRYFLSIYPAFFFLIPKARSLLPGVIMWLGGAMFVAQILVDPFVAAKRPWQNTQQGLFRLLPVELTMIDDLPVQLDQRWHGVRQRRVGIRYGDQPQLILHYLDDNAWGPEEPGIWVSGDARADIVVRTNSPVAGLEVSLSSPIANNVTVTVDGSTQHVGLTPNKSVTLRLPIEGVYSRGAQSFVVTVKTEAGFVPRLRTAGSSDGRFLGVVVGLDGVGDSPDHRPP
jgi:hypothetical protein